MQIILELLIINKRKMRIKTSVFLFFALAIACSSPEVKRENKELAEKIMNDEYFAFTKVKALEIIKTGFNAGDGYRGGLDPRL
jgi:hypothetical protein